MPLRTFLLFPLSVLVCLALSANAFAQSSGFTYQGKLTDSANPADGLFDMQFKLFDTHAVGTGIQQGLTITNSSVQVTNGTFTIELDFGSAVFDGSARFLEISIRPTGSPGAYTVLGPRQALTSAPYAVRSAVATNATQLGGQPASGFIQNTTSQQSSTNFNISGNGTVGGTLRGNVVNATTQYNINGLRMLAANGIFDNGQNFLVASNTFLGEAAGINTTPSATVNSTSGKFNTFVGADAGKTNTTGVNNSFFGYSAGLLNNTGFGNSFFGIESGQSNTTGNDNSFMGAAAGQGNTTGSNNVFIGRQAGDTNTTGGSNTAIGYQADVSSNNLTNATAIGARTRVDQSNALVLGGVTGVNGGTSVNVGIGTTTPQHRLDVVGAINSSTQYNIGGLRMLTVSGPFNNGVTILTVSNTFLGESAGVSTTPSATLSSTTGKFNTFIGANAGKTNTTGFQNSFFGGSAGSSNSTGFVNSFFGANAGEANTTGNRNSFFGSAAGELNTSGFNNSFFGSSAGLQNTTGDGNSFFGEASGFHNTGDNNTFVGNFAGFNNDTGGDNTVIGQNADVGANNLFFATAIGARARVEQNYSLVLGSILGVNGCTAATNCDTVKVGIGTTTPADRLHVAGDIRVGTGTTGCVKDADGTVIAGACPSDARLKHTVTPFPETLDRLIKLRPVHFYWRTDEFPGRGFGSGQSYGLIAQEVEEVMPALVTKDEQGFKAVNYSKLPVLMLQAVRELKAEKDKEVAALKMENDTLKQQIKQQEERLRRLEALMGATREAKKWE
jgi:hypothetical protein